VSPAAHRYFAAFPYAACRANKGYWETSDLVFVSLAKAQPSGMLLAYHHCLYKN
jgi:hypothetical protein